MQSEVDKAVEIIEQGGTVVYPTDTIWGIGCDATNEEAIKKIYAIKQRPESKSLVILVDSDLRLERHIKEVPEVAWQIIEQSNRPITLVLDGAMGIAKNAIAADGSVAIRVCEDPFCKALIKKLRRPIVSTSANLSGQPSPQLFSDIHKDILGAVDYVVNLRQEEQTRATASSIIKLGLNGEINIIRK